MIEIMEFVENARHYARIASDHKVHHELRHDVDIAMTQPITDIFREHKNAIVMQTAVKC